MPTLRQEMQTIKYQAYLWGHSTIDRMIRMGGFTVENINISGLKYTSKIDILNVLNVNYGDNILWVDTQTLLESLKKIGWIEHVTIQKKFPNTIEIFIREYRPYALWQYKNHINVITETGVIIPKADPKHFADLSLVVGEKANLQCKSLFSILTDYPEFKDMIVSAQYVHGRRWRLHFSTNIIVDLPEDNISDTIHKVYTLHQKQKILDRDVEIIDMRIPNKLVFKGSKNLKRTKNLTQQGV
jgi:cell division protein FtsQ